ncbi:MAG: response regulator [Desulfobulbaceae bacterium]|nr:response regulator [Desulfobulbaceae bacterium]
MCKKTILLVDDEETILKSVSNYLKKNGYDVTTAASGEEAIKKLRTTPFDLTITDLAMVGVSGLDVLREIKKNNSTCCVFILTGYGNMESAIDALRSGADDYLLKPCDVEELVLKIKRCLEKQEALNRIKIYENILPICMYCKNIRDDTGVEPGKGKWMSVEEYLHRKSGTTISHGCCHKCYNNVLAKEIY